MRWLVPVVSLLTGCGTSISFTETNTPPSGMAPKAASDVQVFSTAPPDRPYMEVGLLKAQQQSSYSLDGDSAILNKLRQAAAERGCDAIMITGESDAVVGSSSTHKGSGSGSVTTLDGVAATCLVWTGAPAAEAPAAPGAAAPTCVPGESRACVGPGGCSGGQVCAGDGTHFDGCDCGDAGTSAGSPSEPAE